MTRGLGAPPLGPQFLNISNSPSVKSRSNDWVHRRASLYGTEEFGFPRVLSARHTRPNELMQTTCDARSACTPAISPLLLFDHRVVAGNITRLPSDDAARSRIHRSLDMHRVRVSFTTALPCNARCAMKTLFPPRSGRRGPAHSRRRRKRDAQLNRQRTIDTLTKLLAPRLLIVSAWGNFAEKKALLINRLLRKQLEINSDLLSCSFVSLIISVNIGRCKIILFFNNVPANLKYTFRFMI